MNIIESNLGSVSTSRTQLHMDAYTQNLTQ